MHRRGKVLENDHPNKADLAAEIEVILDLISGLSAASGLTSGAYLLCLLIPEISKLAGVAGCLLSGKDCSSGEMSRLLNGAAQVCFVSGVACFASTFSLFAGQKLGIFTRSQSAHVHQPAPGK